MIDDDTELCEMVAEYLKPEGFELRAVHDGVSGITSARENFALVLLDVMLPQMSGLEVLRRIRGGEEKHAHIPILMLTARGDATDRVVGLEIGADDYLPKPFDERELVARMRAILRRAVAAPSTLGASETLRVGDVEINLGARIAKRGDEVLVLTSVEFDLLALLVREAGAVVERDRVARCCISTAASTRTSAACAANSARAKTAANASRLCAASGICTRNERDKPRRCF